MKKFLAFLLAAIMIMGLCTVVHAEKTYKVGVSIYQYTDNFMTLYRNEIEAYFKTLETDDVKYEIIMADGKNDMAEQTNQVQNFITQGVDVIILNLVQTSSADAVIDMIVAAEIPLVLINREPLAYDADGNTIDEAYEGILENAKVCYVGADARQSGTFQGKMVADLADHGDINGDGKISYIMIEGDPENIDAQYRTEFSVKALTDAGYEVECLDDQVGNWDQTKGQELCANALTKFGDKIEVVFCNNDGMALGASTAILTAGRKVGEDIYLLGVDALPEAIDLIRDGDMTGTVLNDHIGQSHAAVDVAVKLLNGEEIQNYYWVDYVMVDKAYVEANY
ncbi:MAG: galactose ABC transporter substrate-binding protein [Clostridia bacterium]|nr:galactose ABC transporter substrate-binding protein [Clostridia bacterium]